MKIVSIILLALLQFSSYTLAQTTGGGGRKDVIAGLAAQGQNSMVPTITSFSPTSGCQGSGIVTITGTFFTGATAVSIGGSAVSTFTVDSATQITATVGSGTSGTIQVTTPAGTTTSSGTFTVNPLPSAAGSISGPATVCQGQNSVNYTVPAIANASAYLWTLPTGASIASGSNTNSITVNYSITASSGPITVQGTNTCGNGMVSAVPGANDPTFNTTDLGFGIGDAANGNVHATTLQPDGKILIGGDFISYNGTARTRIARLNADGYLDPSFNPGSGPSNSVYTIALQTDGKMIIGGQFIQFNIAVRNRIARLNADGSLDVSFNPGTGANSTIWTTVLQPDGKVLIGGDFTSYSGTARNRIARLNADGSLDVGFNPGTGADGSVQTIALQPDGKILIGGLFTSCNGTARNRIARLNADGSLDTSFNPGTGANGDVRTTTVQSDGKILIGGDFTSFNGTTRIRIARMNADGSLDVDFNPGAGANGTVRTNTLRPDGKILIGGGFINYNLLARIGVALLNADGSLDTSFNPNPGTNGIVQAITIQSNGKIVIGGTFTQYNPSTIKNRIVRLNTNGSLDTGFNSGTGADGTVLTTALQPDGKIIIGGTFSSYNGTVCPDIARLNTDGSIDTSFNPGTGTNGTLRTTALQPDGKILIGGDFTSYNGTTRNLIARLNADGSLDASFNPLSGASSTISTVALQPDGKIIIGGDFSTYNGTLRGRIARLNADGSLDAGFNPGTGANGFVRTTTVQPDGKILIGGNFTSYNGTSRSGLARLNTDGSMDAGFAPGSGPTSLSPVRTITLQPDGKILFGGDFTSYNGLSRNGIARLNADGSLDSSFSPGGGANFVYTIALQPDGKVLIGGDFSTYNFTGRNRIARLNANGSLDASFNPGTGANNYVYTIAQQAVDKIFIGGAFTSYNGIGRNRITRVYGTGLFVTVNPLPFSAGSISGPSTVCQGQNAVIYTVPEIVNASGYLWNLPTGASIAWSNNNVISANYSASANSGSIRVRGTNSCGNGTISPTFSVTVNKLPSPAGSISGQATVCQGQNGVSYTVPVISNASTYLWTLPTGASIASGSNTRSITVNYSASASSGAITVQGTNTCGNGTISPAYAVSVNTICSLSVSVRLFNEGFYIGNNLMTSALFTSGQSTNSLACDSITVELRDPLSPSVSLFTQKVTLQTNGLAAISVPFALSGINAFIVVRHRNSIETWSKIPVLIQNNLVLDFRNP